MSTKNLPQPATPGTAIAPRTLADQLADRGVTNAQWLVLINSLYPGAAVVSGLMVLDYCKARGLDPMKKPCHIVPMNMKVGGEWVMRDVVLPGIYEYRTTAMRTGRYLGHTEPLYGPDDTFGGVVAPQWCAMTFKRAAAGGVVIEFPVKVYFREVCNTKDEWVDGKKTGKVVANDRWAKAPIQMLTKCAEAAGLREAFPDEFGGEATFEEMAGRDVGGVEEPASTPVRPAQRISQQQPQEAAAPAEAVTSAEVPEDAPAAAQAPQAAQPKPASIGTIAQVIDRSTAVGTPAERIACVIVLDNGFKAAAVGPELKDAAEKRMLAKIPVDLVCRPSSDPAKYPPVVEAIELAPQ